MHMLGALYGIAVWGVLVLATQLEELHFLLDSPVVYLLHSASVN